MRNKIQSELERLEAARHEQQQRGNIDAVAFYDGKIKATKTAINAVNRPLNRGNVVNNTPYGGCP